MRQPIHVIAQRSDKRWRHIKTGDVHRVVFACPREVITISMTHSWLGRASDFVREFECIE